MCVYIYIYIKKLKMGRHTKLQTYITRYMLAVGQGAKRGKMYIHAKCKKTPKNKETLTLYMLAVW